MSHPAPRLLLVDADPTHRDRLVRAMERLGWRVWAFAGVGDAEGALADAPADLQAVLVDLDQPGFGGGRLLARLGQTRPAVARCGMAGGFSPYTATAFRRASGIPLAAKPVDADRWDRRLRAMMDECETDPADA